MVVAGFTVCDQFPDPALGIFTDYIAQFNFIVAGPAPESPVVSQVFNQTLQTGIGSFAIAPAAPYGTFSGQILLTYDLYSRSPNDPLFDPGRRLHLEWQHAHGERRRLGHSRAGNDSVGCRRRSGACGCAARRVATSDG